ncbi:7832_t:CDS:2 [Entrophospora sp. SA101]|nr:7832_t:CDS:2 [Entrophospora sp. SA101]
MSSFGDCAGEGDEDGRGQKEELESEKFVFNCLEASVGSEDNINLKWYSL